MLVNYTLKYNNGRLFNNDGNSAWISSEGQEIRHQIDKLVEQFGLVRESPHRNPETVDLAAAIEFLSACNSLSTAQIKVEAKIVCPIEFHKETLKEYRLQEISPSTINLIDEKGNSPGFVWRGCEWAWHDYENNRQFIQSTVQTIERTCDEAKITPNHLSKRSRDAYLFLKLIDRKS